MARLRGFERWNNTQVGADLVIKKLNPGIDDGVGYQVSIFQDGVFKDKIKITSKKKLKELIDEFKGFYHTDKAFLNGMLFHITYKDDREKDAPKKNKSIEEKAVEEDDKTMSDNKHAAGIENVLYKKAALIERKLNRLFQPSLPIVKHAEADQTLEFISQCKQKIDAFANENQALMNTSESYKLYNAMEAWIAELNNNLDKDPSAIADIEKVKTELADYFSNYTFLREKRTASSAVIITDDNIEQLIDSLDDVSTGNPTDSKIENIVDALNDVSGATDDELAGAECISKEIPKAVVGDESTKICIATEDVVDMLVKRFRDDIGTTKYSGSLQDAVIDWALKNDIDARYAELTYKFCEADFSPNRLKLRYAAMNSVGVADSDATKKATDAFLKAFNDASANYPDPNADYSATLDPFIQIVNQSIHDDVYTGNKFRDVVLSNCTASSDCSVVILAMVANDPNCFPGIAAALQASGSKTPIADVVINEISGFIGSNVESRVGGSFKKWTMDVALAFGIKYGCASYQADYDEMLKTL